MLKLSLKAIIPVTILILFWFIPSPAGLSTEAWIYSGIFFAVVAGLITEPIPAALVGFTGISLVAMLGLVGNSKESISWALSGFSNTIIWLIFSAFMFALGYKKTGLGKRLSLILIQKMGKSSLGLGYAVAFADLILSPFMPSNTARSAGTIYPIAINIPVLFNSTSENEPRKLGSYISWVGITTTCITSSMFLTALAPNLLAVDLIAQATGKMISWSAWAKIMLPLMVPLFFLTPWFIFLVYPPKQKHSPEAPIWAIDELKKMGSITNKEVLMASLGFITLILWIFADRVQIHPSTTAITAVSVMVLLKIISWDNIISEKNAFNVLIWFASLVTLADGLNKVGILLWIGDITEIYLTNLAPSTSIIFLLFLFFVLHYLFASTTAHTTALMPIFIAIAMRLLEPEQIFDFSILLSGSLGVMGILTPYSTGPSPIWYGAGYISQAKWWGLGSIFGTIFFVTIFIGKLIFV